jgi:2-keto-3-deoxy-6-phosphogluconate aldolase
MSTTPMMTQVLHKSRVIPVATIEDADHAQAIGESLLEGGVGVIEVTLRTRQALRAIERLRRDVPEMMVGAGTVWTAEDWVQAESAGGPVHRFPRGAGGTGAVRAPGPDAVPARRADGDGGAGAGGRGL